MDELIEKLNTLSVGQCAVVPYELIDEIFVPGFEDDGAKGAAYMLAKAHGCVIDNRPDLRAVYFLKEA